jgi:5-methyltetrahydrofolate--homocysteine methyltransferase
MDGKLIELSEAVIKGNHRLAPELVQWCLDQGMAPEVILENGLIAGMSIMGGRFRRDEVFMPEVLVAARAMNAGLAVLDPLLSSTGVKPKGKLVLGTVRGDLHDVGKNIVSIMFRGAGFHVIDLGIDVPEERFVNAVEEHRPDLLGLSALLSLTLPMMRSTIEAVQRANLSEEIIVLVGGAPVTQSFCEEIGADGYAPDASSGVEKAKELMAARGKVVPLGAQPGANEP